MEAPVFSLWQAEPRVICRFMAVLMRLISLILIVIALMLLGADAVTSLERGGELTVRSLGTIWGLLHHASLDSFKSWVQNRLPFMAQGVYSALALPGWAATGVIGVILAFVFGRKLGPE
jgi:lipopolysaccharide export LptBFGC system permease protein LptF